MIASSNIHGGPHCIVDRLAPKKTPALGCPHRRHPDSPSCHSEQLVGLSMNITPRRSPWQLKASQESNTRWARFQGKCKSAGAGAGSGGKVVVWAVDGLAGVVLGGLGGGSLGSKSARKPRSVLWGVTSSPLSWAGGPPPHPTPHVHLWLWLGCIRLISMHLCTMMEHIVQLNYTQGFWAAQKAFSLQLWASCLGPPPPPPEPILIIQGLRVFRSIVRVTLCSLRALPDRECINPPLPQHTKSVK